MSELTRAFSEEDQYANDSFETELPESSLCESENENTEMNQKQEKEKPVSFGRLNPDFWTCESSSDEDDVVLGETVAEINTDNVEYDDDNLSLTPAARVFRMASSSRKHQVVNGMPTPPNSKENLTDEEDDLTECEEFDELDTIAPETDTEEIFRKYTQLTTEEEILYNDDFDYDENIENMDMDDIYTDVGIDDGGEIDVGEPNIVEELGEEEEENELADEVTDEEQNVASDKESASPRSGDEELPKNVVTKASEEYYSDSRSLRKDDSMENFKRRVMLSHRMRCQSEGAGDGAGFRSLQPKSSIPVWVGSRGNIEREDGEKPVRNKNRHSAFDMRKKSSLPELSETETLTPRAVSFHAKSEGAYSEQSYEDIDRAAGGDYSESIMTGEFTEYEDESYDGKSCAYSMEMEMIVKTANKSPKTQKKLKAGERRNLSFSNDRLRDIERHNQILLRKILSQKPTYVLDEKKKKVSKFSVLPPTTRVSSAEVNRKKQQRQIDMDNQLLKRKLEAISKRNSKPKQK